MPLISLIFLAACAFLLGAWLTNRWERRRLDESNSLSSPMPTMKPSAMATSSPTRSQKPTSARLMALEQEVQQLLTQNRKIEAIKRVREETGYGLKQAKDYVERLQQGYRVELSQGGYGAGATVSPEIAAAARQLMAEKQKIAAIKLVRDQTGWGLKEAKEYVERL